MINEENLNKLYNGVIDEKELTTKTLNSYGFNSNDLTDLIKRGTLKRVKRGHYSFISADELFQYGNELINKKEFEKSTKCFEKCYELDPNYPGICYQLFLRSIVQKDYISCFKYFDEMLNTEEKYYKETNNFYLYLLNIVTDIPEKYEEYVKNLKLEDIIFSPNDKNNYYIYNQNEIRSLAFSGKFYKALKKLKPLMNNNKKITSYNNIITNALLSHATVIECTNKNTLLKLSKINNYKQIIKILENQSKKYNLSDFDLYTLKIAKEIVNLRDTKQPKEKTVFETENLYEAIDGNNYDLALELIKKHDKETGKKSIIQYLLVDMQYLIKKFSYKPKTLTKPRKIKENKIVNNIIEPSTTYNNEKSRMTCFKDIIYYLMRSDLENTFKTLTDYMEEIDKKDYEFLIVDLIKLSLLEKDIAFTKPMITLTYMNKGSFEFDISKYIQDFYIALSQDKYKEARIYLDIITKSKSLVKKDILTDELSKVLNNAKRMIQKNINAQNVEKINQPLTNDKNITNNINEYEQYNQPISLVELPKNEIKTNQKLTDKKQMSNDEKFIDNKHELLLNGQGMILLKPMTEEKIKTIEDIVSKYPDMESFSIG